MFSFMKVIHIAPNSSYTGGWSYQENYLPKYQAKLGHDVILITTNLTHVGMHLVECGCEDFISEEGFRVIRQKSYTGFCILYKDVFKKLPVYDILVREHPDFIFFHGLVNSTIFQVCKYKRKVNRACVIVQDNHLDPNIGYSIEKARSPLRFYVLRSIYRTFFLITKNCISKVYGVTPWRQTYAEKYFGVPAAMTDLLIMGADDEKINFNERDSIRSDIRKKFEIKDTDVLICTGGKIDAKKRITLLMDAVKLLDNVKLLIFGDVSDTIKDEFTGKLSDKIVWVGFIPSDECYNYFLASDLAVFPGQHSVLWEQACACKIPCLFARWEGMEHVNNGGNSDFIDDISVEGIKEKISQLMFSPEYEKMKRAAESDKTDIYLYSKIAEKSLECAALK